MVTGIRTSVVGGLFIPFCRTRKKMKRALEADIVLCEESKQVLAAAQKRLENAAIMAQCFFDHVKALYSNEAMYMDDDACYMRLEHPHMTFEWVNTGIDKDEFHILGSTSALLPFFTFLGKDGKVWHLTEDDHKHALELLLPYFEKNHSAELFIEAWGEGTYPAARIGATTNYKWVTPAEDNEDEESSDDNEEKEKDVDEDKENGV